MTAIVYCDGSGLADGGPGGCGYVAEVAGQHREGMLPLRHATNQMAEILAAAWALHELEPHTDVLVYSDSQYVVRGVNEWLPGWIGRGWRTASNRPVANRPHWERLLAAIGRHGTVRFEWVRGHAGTAGNERADVLAGEARELALLGAEAV